MDWEGLDQPWTQNFPPKTTPSSKWKKNVIWGKGQKQSQMLRTVWITSLSTVPKLSRVVFSMSSLWGSIKLLPPRLLFVFSLLICQQNVDNPRKYSCFDIQCRIYKLKHPTTHHVISRREPFMQISTRPSRPCASANCTHSSACQLHSTLKLHCAFRVQFYRLQARLVLSFLSEEQSRH